MSENHEQSGSKKIPDEFIFVPTEQQKQVYRDLLTYATSIGWENGEVVVFSLQDGSTKFSLSDSLHIWLNVTEEGALSDRLLVVVSVAYLEDRIRILLEKFLTSDDITQELLDPHRGSLSSLMPMASVAFSLGLVAKEWYEILKRMAQLRNKFAHIPYARRFEDLITMDIKVYGLIESLIHRYKTLEKIKEIDTDDFRTIYGQLFHLMYNLIQFAIDHIATSQRREPFDYNQILGYEVLVGFSKELLQQLINDD